MSYWDGIPKVVKPLYPGIHYFLANDGLPIRRIDCDAEGILVTTPSSKFRINVETLTIFSSFRGFEAFKKFLYFKHHYHTLNHEPFLHHDTQLRRSLLR